MIINMLELSFKVINPIGVKLLRKISVYYTIVDMKVIPMF